MLAFSEATTHLLTQYAFILCPFSFLLVCIVYLFVLLYHLEVLFLTISIEHGSLVAAFVAATT